MNERIVNEPACIIHADAALYNLLNKICVNIHMSQKVNLLIT